MKKILLLALVGMMAGIATTTFGLDSRGRYSGGSLTYYQSSSVTPLPQITLFNATATTRVNYLARFDNPDDANAKVLDSQWTDITWSSGATAGKFVKTLDTTNWKTSLASSNNTFGSVRFTAGDFSAETAYNPYRFWNYVNGSEEDISAADTIEITYYLPAITAPVKLVALSSIVWTLTEGADKVSLGQIGNQTYAGATTYDSSFLTAGWHTLRCAFADMSLHATSTYTALRGAGLAAYFRSDASTWATPPTGWYITIDSIKFIKQTQTKQWAICFDDGGSTTGDGYDVVREAAILNSYNLKGTFFIIGSKVGTAGFATLAQLKEVQAQGHLIANHGWISPPYQEAGTVVTEAGIRADIKQMQAWMYANGFSKGARIYAPPQGTPQGLSGDAGQQMTWFRDLRNDICDIVRFTMRDPSYPAIGKLSMTPRYREPGIVYCTTWQGQSTANNDAAVDAAIAGVYLGGWYGHGLSTLGGTTHLNTAADIKYVASKVASGDIECITLDELLK